MPKPKTPKKSRAPKIISLIVVLITLFVFVWSIYSDRRTPSTDQARVKGLVQSVSPLVSGYISEVNVTLHSHVTEGDVLFKIDATPYEIAVAVAEANLEKTSQSIDASVSSITAAVARLNKTKVELERATKNWERVQKIIQQNAGALSVADQDRVETKYLESIEKVEASKAELAKQRKALGPTNADNPNLKSALSQFEKAQWDAENTVVRASADGVIESFNVEVGHFAAAGRPLISLVSNKTLWIQANFKENNISNMQIGDPAEIIFDISPGTVFKGNLSSIGYGVTTDRTNPGGLPQISSAQGWLRDPQRFPVIIDVEDETILKQLRQGSQVTVVVYTGDHPFLNALGRFRIRLLSKLSYIR